MILSLIVLVLVGLVGFFHMKQGLFTGTISAILSAVAAILAIGLHEFMATSLLKGAIAELAYAVAMVGTYALVYLVLRLIFDNVIKTNVEVPVMADRIGGVVGGLIAGVFATGVLVTAMQTLPLGPVVLGYSRYETIAAPIAVSLKSGESSINSALKSDVLEEVPHGRLILPVDDIVVGIASRVGSAGGALEGSQSMAVIHPAYLDELFMQRVGIQAGAKRTAVNLPDSSKEADVAGLYIWPGALNVEDAEIPALDKERWSKGKLEKVLKVGGGDVILVARMTFSSEAADTDSKVRLSPGAVRLVAGGKNHFPIGTLDWFAAPVLRRNRPDDFIIVPGGGKVDFVFQIAAEEIGVNPKDKDKQIAADVFIEAKRMGLIDLSKKPVSGDMPKAMAAGEATVLRKELIHPIVPKPAAPAGDTSPASAPAPAPTPAAPVEDPTKVDDVDKVDKPAT